MTTDHTHVLRAALATMNTADLRELRYLVTEAYADRMEAEYAAREAACPDTAEPLTLDHVAVERGVHRLSLTHTGGR